MPWVEPPLEIQRRVRRELGDDIYEQLAQKWDRLVAIDPSVKLTQWYRSPREALCEKFGGAYCDDPTQKPNPRAALYSQHGLGLAVDVTPRPERRAAFMQAARAQGFSVSTYPSSRHVHVAALSDAAWAASRLLPYLRGLIAPVLARRD